MGRAVRFVRTLFVALLLGAAMPASAAAMTFCQVDADPPPLAQGDSRAIGLRVARGQLLGEHAFLLMKAMRADHDAEQTVFESALRENSTALIGAMAGI